MKKFTVILAALAVSLCAFAEDTKPEIVTIGIAGRATGYNEFNTMQMFTEVADGEFVWMGYLQHKLTESGSQGFKCQANSTKQNDWLNVGCMSLRAVGSDNAEVENGGTYDVDYSQQTTNNDFKWRLKEGEDGYYKITYYTANVNAVTMKVERVAQDLAELLSLSVDGAELTPAFDSNVFTYACELMKGTVSVTPTATAYAFNTISGDEPVDVSGGSGVSTIVVTALDGITTKTYTINYIIAEGGAEDLTKFIINNNFDYVAPGIAWNDSANVNYPKHTNGTKAFITNAWRPVVTDVTTVDAHLEFYGWQLSNWEFLFKDETGAFINADETSPNQSIGINAGVKDKTNGSSAWISGSAKCVMPNDFEFYQVIDKENLGAGTYQVNCLLGVEVSARHTSQRLFANNKVQYYGNESDYELNKTEGEICTYAGYSSTNADNHYEMTVYVTISDDESLKIGIRSGNKTGSGEEGGLTAGSACRGWFKMDDFRLLRLDASATANASLKNLALSAATLEFVAGTKTYNVEFPAGTESVTVTATPEMAGVKIDGAGDVVVAAEGGSIEITVTAPDGTTTETYTINYTVAEGSGFGEVIAKATYFVDNGQLTVSGVDSYVVYALNGTKVADVKENAAGTAINLAQGAYIVKTNAAQTFKVLVK